MHYIYDGGYVYRKVNEFFIRGKYPRRALYAAVKRMLNYRVIQKRRQLAQDVMPELEISNKDGLLKLTPGQIGNIDALVEATRAAVGERATLTKSGYISQSDLTLDSPFLEFALRQDIIMPIAAYLKVVPILSYIDVWCSQYQGPSPKGTQLYHCDWNENAQVKVFVYASDVEKTNGPFVAVRACASEQVRDRLGYCYRKRVDDQKLFSLVDRRNEMVLTGQAGTTIFADTSRCFHYGGRLAEAAIPRILCMFMYVTPVAFNLPIFGYQKGATCSHLATPKQDRLKRMVLGAE